MNNPVQGRQFGREAVEEFYASYYSCLDEVELDRWPQHFTENCLYRVVARENFERSLPLSTILCESRGALEDRVMALTKTQVYAPRYYRRFTSPMSIQYSDDGSISIAHNLLMVQTLIDKQSEITLSARCYDKLVNEGGALLLHERVVVFDSEMIPNSLIYPV